MSKSVFVGMSGGVDSSLTAALLVEQGYDVTGVYMKNWSKDLPGFPCPWKEDYQDAKRVAVQLGIPFVLFDFEQEYFEHVVQYMLDGYSAGLTPNPDIICNQEIKFKLFYELAREKGADFIATGHYARVSNSENPLKIRLKSDLNPLSSDASLLQAVDGNKDQTYFLYRVSPEALAHTLFPLGEFTKPQVRVMAQERQLSTARKKESMGICFVGKVGIKEFLSQYVTTEPGDIIDQSGSVIGTHDGAIFYTIGQRHGLDIGGGLPYYVTGKDMKKNQVFVTNVIDDEQLWTAELKLSACHWLAADGKHAVAIGQKVHVRTRHRAALVDAVISSLDSPIATITLTNAIRAATPGQSAVLYDGELVLGGGIIT